MKNRDKEYELTKSMINQMKSLDENVNTQVNHSSQVRDMGYESMKSMLNTMRVLNEAEEEKDKAIPITNDPKFGQNVLKNQIDAFRSSVHGGAKFASENQSDPESNPLVFYPKSGNLIFSGSIPNLSDLKFQFSLNDVTNAPYVFVDGLALTDDVITTLNKLHGYYKNWVEEWQASTDLLDKLK